MLRLSNILVFVTITTIRNTDSKERKKSTTKTYSYTLKKKLVKNKQKSKIVWEKMESEKSNEGFIKEMSKNPRFIKFIIHLFESL